MRKYTSGGQLEAVVCNCCGKKLIVVDGIVREGVLSINHAWDFFSEKDGEMISFFLSVPRSGLHGSHGAVYRRRWKTG